MKRALSLFLSLVIVVCICFFNPLVVEATAVDDFVFFLNSGGNSYSARLRSGTISGVLVVPETYNGLPVTNLYPNGDTDTSSLTSVTIPKTIKTIHYETFLGCDNLDIYITDLSSWCEIYFGDTSGYTMEVGWDIKGWNLFLNNELITELLMPTTSSKINKYAFYNCKSITKVVITDNVTEIGSYAFEGCTSLETITVGDGVVNIGYGVFRNCTLLRTVTIGNSVSNIDGGAFFGCASLEMIDVLSDNITYSSIDGVLYNKDKTNLITYPSGKTESTYSVPTGTKIIEEYSFRDCNALTSIIFPDSVTTINADFSNCNALTSVTIGEGVTNIGGFYECNSLEAVYIKNLESWCNIEFNNQYNNPLRYAGKLYLNDVLIRDLVIPDGVKELNAYAFRGGSYIRSVTIPSSVSKIGADAFYNCSSLKSIKLHENIDCIASDAFYNCGYYRVKDNWKNGVLYIDNYLVDADPTLLGDCVLEEGTKGIAGGSFYNCKSLTSITIPKTVKFIGFENFSFTCDLKKVYYKGEKKEWDQINIDGYNNYLLNAKIYYNTGNNIAPIETIETNKTNETLFFFYNSTPFLESNTNDDVNLWLDEVNIKYNNTGLYCDKKYSLDLSGITTSNIVFSRENFQDYIIPKAVFSTWVNKQKTFDVFMGKDKKDGKPYISTVFARITNDEEQVYEEVTTQTVNVLEDENCDVIISVASLNGEVPKEYWLSQGEGHKISNVTGEFLSTYLFDVFEVGKPVYAYVTFESGLQTEPVQVKLERKEHFSDALKKREVNILGDDFLKISVPDDVPILGGQSLKVGFVEVPVGVQVEGDRIRISVGVDVFSYDAGKKDTEKWTWFKDSIKTINEIMDDKSEKAKAFDELLDSLGSDGLNGANQKKKLSFEGDFLGYAEGYKTNDGFVWTELCGSGVLALFVNVKEQLVVGGLPCYVYVKAGGELSGEYSEAIVIPDKNLNVVSNFKVKFEPQANVGGGIGVDDILAFGLYGKAKIPLVLDIQKDYNHLTWDLIGEFGVEMELLFVTIEEKIFEGEVHIIDKYYAKTKTSTNALSHNIYEFMNPEYSNSMQSNSSVKLLSRDYADDTSNWLGDIYSPKQHLSSLFGITQDITVKDLQTSVYKNSQLQLIEFNDTMMMAWIEDCEERDDYNRFRLVYSVYNPTFDTWSDPIAVDDNGRNDSAPSLATDGENVYIAWQNSNEIFTTVDDTTTEKILQSTEIKTAKYNSETGLFDSVKTLTDNATYDYAPTISVNDGVATICWVNSTTTDFASGTLSILKNEFSDINTIVAENLNYVTSLETNGNDVSYSMDIDGDLTTDDVYAFTNNIQQTGLEEESLSTPELTYGLLDNEAVLFFVDACNIRYIKQGVVYDVFEDGRAVGGNINVVNNNGVTTLSWTESTEVGTELFASSYENGEWTEPIQLTKLNAIISNIDLVSYNGSLYGAFNRTNLIEETDIDGEVIYTQSSTDICLLKSNGFTDIEVSNVFVDEKTFLKGETATVSVVVTNNGTEKVENIEFNISDGLGTSLDVTKNICIASGATEIIELPYAVAEEFTETTLTISATVESDSNTENNSSSTVVGLTDISISDMDTEKVGSTYVISGFVNNPNCIDAENVVVRIVLSDSDEELSTVEIGSIAAKETKEVQFFVTENILEVTTEPKTIKFIAETTSEETLTTNNEGVVAILHDEVDGCEHIYEDWTVIKEATCTETGVQRSICTTCGIPNTEIIETKHNYENNLVFDDDKHWRFCADDCGTMLDEELHEFDEYGVCTCGKYEAPENVDGVYQIETERDLMWLAQKVNYGLGSPNVTLKENVYIRADEWLSIGTEEYPYMGVFDGAFNVINDGTDAGIRGIFGVTENAIIRNLGVEGIYIDIEDEGIENVGIIANKLLNSQVLNCYTQGYVYAPDSVTIGGISVDATGSTLINCYTNVGELTNNAQSLENCYYLSDEENDYGGKTYQQFELGEVTYALNNGVTDGTQLWYQTLGSCDYPQFYGATVYYDDNLSCYYNNVDLLTVADTKTTTVDLNQNIVRTSVTALDYISNILSVPFGYSLEVEPSFNFVENEFFGTSSKINVYLDDVLLVSYTLVVEGDVNGDSVCDALDCMLVQLAITGDLTLEKEYLTAADFTADNRISVEDFQEVVNRVMESHEIFTFELNDDETGYILTDCRFDTEGEVVVPSSYYGVPVLTIGKEAFKNCGEITRIAISEGVRTIERDAFYNCGSLKEISFPKSLEKFTDYTLIGACDSLDSVFFGGSNIEWEKLLQYDEEDDMSYVDEFDEFIIHYNSTNHSFSEWETNPSTCDEYGYKKRVCSVCDKTETIYLELEMHTFIDGICTVCETPIFEYDVFDDEVGIWGYNGYDEELIIPNQIENCSVTYLESSAFAGNKMLKSVVLPDSINAITNWCFENCTSLETVTIPKSVQYINSGAFSGCNNLKTIIYTGSRDEWQNIQIGLNSELEKADIIFQEQ